MGTSLVAFTFPGTYEDAHGTETIEWLVCPSTRRSPPGSSGFELRTEIRGVAFSGYDFDGLEPRDAAHASSRGFMDGDLSGCILSGELPCIVERGVNRRRGVVKFRLDLRAHALRTVSAPANLRLVTAIEGRSHVVDDNWFEEGLLRLEETLPANVRFVCCVTCLYSDYSPAGHGLLGMRCHREAKDQYLAVRSKGDYWSVPVTEDVMETHVCIEYKRRVPRTGYRGPWT